jgi:small subunit ribosomal protein S20
VSSDEWRVSNGECHTAAIRHSPFATRNCIIFPFSSFFLHPNEFTLYLPPEFYRTMANHKSAITRIRSNNAKRLRNKYYHKTMRNAMRKLRALTTKKEASALLPKVVSMLDKLAKNSVIHKNKAGNLKGKAQVFVNKLK